MIVWLAIIFFPGITVGIKVNQCDRAVSLFTCSQLRKRDTVIATHRDRYHTGFKQGGHSSGYFIKGIFHIPRNSHQVAIINTFAVLKDVYIQHRIIPFVQWRDIPDGTWTKPGAYTEGGAGVVGKSYDGKVYTLQILRVRHSHESPDSLIAGKLHRI